MASHNIANAPLASRQWRSPETQELNRLNRARRTLCPRSPYLPSTIPELVALNTAIAAAKSKASKRRAAQTASIIEQRQREQIGDSTVPPPFIKPAFDGKEFSTNHSAVLCLPTVFVPTCEKSPSRTTIGGMAAWPSKQEMKYEGDDRIATDRLHGRFPPAPRVTGNGTVNWQQRTVIVPEVLDHFYPGAHVVEVWWRNHWVEDNEVGEAEGVELVGGELMRILGESD